MPPTLVDPTLLFEFAISIARLEVSTTKLGTKKSAKTLQPTLMHWLPQETQLLPHFAALSGCASHSSVYAAWSEEGLFFQAIVRGKAKPPRFVQARGGFSDGLRVWIDTRSSPGIHRGTRFCHCFHFFPGLPNANPESQTSDRPHGILDEIPRSREHPAPISEQDLVVHSLLGRDGYTLKAQIPARCLTGYSPLEFDRISLFYDVVDHELGTQSMSLGPELRYAEDPSLWVSATLK